MNTTIENDVHECERCSRPATTTIETGLGAELVCDGCKQALHDNRLLVNPRYTLSDLANDKKKLLAWLNYDGTPPTVYVNASGHIWGPRTTCKTVIDEETLAVWWSDHRAALAHAWAKSPLNQHKEQTHTQWLAECLKAIGIKPVGTVKERVQRAVIMRPDIYTDAATLKAEQAAKDAAILAAWQARNNPVQAATGGQAA